MNQELLMTLNLYLEDEALLEEENAIEEKGMIVDEGYRSALDCSTCRKSLAKMEESYK